MKSLGRKSLKKEIFHSIYEDNLELQNYHPGKLRTVAPTPKISENKVAAYWLGIVLFCLLTIGFRFFSETAADPSITPDFQTAQNFEVTSREVNAATVFENGHEADKVEKSEITEVVSLSDDDKPDQTDHHVPWSDRLVKRQKDLFCRNVPPFLVPIFAEPSHFSSEYFSPAINHQPNLIIEELILPFELPSIASPLVLVKQFAVDVLMEKPTGPAVEGDGLTLAPLLVEQLLVFSDISSFSVDRSDLIPRSDHDQSEELIAEEDVFDSELPLLAEIDRQPMLPQDGVVEKSLSDFTQSSVSAESDVGAEQIPFDSLFPLNILGLVDKKINLARLFDLQVQTIIIDPGHGGRDPGTVGGQTGLTEKEVTLDVALMLKEKLEKESNFRVLLTRKSDTTISLKERVEFVKKNQGDLFVSIHVNSLPNESDDLVETFFFGAFKDERIAMLAEKENRGSQYTLGDFTEMVSILEDTLKTQESQYLAQSVQDNLYTSMQQNNDQLVDAGIKTAPFVVLLGVDVPAILTEIACVSNNEEEAKLSRPDYRQNIAEYLDRGIREYLERKASESTIAQGVKHHGIFQQKRKKIKFHRY